MKLHTQQEYSQFSDFQLFRLRELHQHKPETFQELANYLPYAVYINDRQSLATTWANQKLAELIEVPLARVYDEGVSLIHRISDRDFMLRCYTIIQEFNRHGELGLSCTYLQRMRVNGTMNFFYTRKSILDEGDFFNLIQPLTDFGKPGKMLNDLLTDFLINRKGFSKYQMLTGREKAILKLVCAGESSQRIADQLFLSVQTIKSYRKSVNQKLEVNSMADLVKFAIVFDII